MRDNFDSPEFYDDEQYVPRPPQVSFTDTKLIEDFDARLSSTEEPAARLELCLNYIGELNRKFGLNSVHEAFVLPTLAGCFNAVGEHSGAAFMMLRYFDLLLLHFPDNHEDLLQTVGYVEAHDKGLALIACVSLARMLIESEVYGSITRKVSERLMELQNETGSNRASSLIRCLDRRS